MVFKVINIFISLIFFIYYVFLQKYIINKFISQKANIKLFLIYWIDYNIIILSLVIISIFFTIISYLNISNISNEIDEDIKNILLIIFDSYFPLFSSSNFIVDIILAFHLLLKINKMKIYKNRNYDITKIDKLFQKINIMSHYSIIHHLIILFFTYVINIGIIFISEYIIDKKYKDILINLYQLILFISTIIFMLILSNRNKSLIGHQIFIKNNVVEKIYNNNKIKLVASNEYLLNKFISDLLLNIPYIIKLFYNSSSDLFKLCYFYSIMFTGFLYLFFFGAMLLSIDSTNYTLLPCILKMLFFTKKFHFYFGDGKKIIRKILKKDDTNIFNYNIYFNKSRLFNSREDFINKLNGITGYSETTISSLFDISESFNDDNFDDKTFTHANTIEVISQNKIIDEKIKEIEKQKIKKESEYGPCNFFIIFKLIYLYYNSNIAIYEKVKKNAEENGFFTDNNYNSNLYKTSTQKLYGRFSNNFNSSSGRKISIINIKEKMDLLNKTESDDTQLKSYRVYNINEVMGNIQEYGMKTLFLKYLSKNLEKNEDNKKNNNQTIDNDNKFFLPPEVLKDNSNTISTINNIAFYSKSNLNIHSTENDIDENALFYDFKIESLMNFVLLDLFPFYEIDIKDILNSLSINNNMNLFEIFFRKKNDDKNFNSFYTYDSFLSLEIYDNNFLSYAQLKSFMTNYKKYFLDKLSNFSYTYLPLILGIFNITYLSYNKIVIVYRNPLAFTPNVFFHYWLKFVICDDSEKIEKSTNNTDIVDINEVEVVNNIKLNNEDYSDIIKILGDDLNFLSKINFNLDFKLNLFILNNINKSNTIEDDIINNQDQKNKNNISQNINLMNIIRNTELFPGNNNSFSPYQFKNKFFGSESISFLENLYMSDSTNNNYVFKIYFGEIFKKKNINNDNGVYTNTIKNINSKNNINILKDNELINNKCRTENKKTTSLLTENDIKEYNQKFCENVKNKLLKKIGKSEKLLFEEDFNIS